MSTRDFKLYVPLLFVVCFVFFTLFMSVGQAQEYPTKPITMIVGFAPGGSTDLSARKLGELARKFLNDQPVVVENRAGGAGTIGSMALATAKPDGYTLSAIGASSSVIVPHLREVSYDTKKDFAYIMQYGEYPQIFCVKKDNPANSWKAWIEWAKKNVDKATYTSPGAGSVMHIFLAHIFHLEKIRPIHIPFGGGAQAAVAVMAGNVNAIAAADVTPHIKSGELKPLAVANDARLMEFTPNIPTFGELGYTQVRAAVWLGIAVPAKTPPAILRRLEEAFTKAAKEPEFLDVMKRLELSTVFKNSSTFRKTVETDYDYYRAIIKDLNITAK